MNLGAKSYGGVGSRALESRMSSEVQGKVKIKPKRQSAQSIYKVKHQAKGGRILKPQGRMNMLVRR